jgi:hypothetical protein
MTRLTLIASAILLAPPALAQTPQHPADHSAHEQQPQQQPVDPHAAHGAMDHPQDAADDRIVDFAVRTMRGSLGAYPSERDGSGTSWVPEDTPHHGVHGYEGGWTLMGHATIDGAYSWQDGPRGDELGFFGGMLMGAAQHYIGDNGLLQLRGMLSPDPLMGDHGYPLLLAAGETADGVNTLVDRQHPHDFFMELSASYAHQLSEHTSVFVYAALPGEPAFGPPVFMHRPAAMPSPEAPITHHWFDSTHITFGVLTAGFVYDDFKIEASGFRGREPDENRWDIETGELDSTSVRLSWNPTNNGALQASRADLTSPEQLDPGIDETRYSASVLYQAWLNPEGIVSLTGAFGRKDKSDGVMLDAWLGEAAWSPNEDWTLFSRLEAIETDELGLVPHGPIEDVARLSVGLTRNFEISQHVAISVGASVAQDWVSDALAPLYDGDPVGAMAFVRLKVG